MEQIGQLFLEKRKELKLSLREAESGTSIRANYLQLIEEGKIFDFIARVYAQGFLKQYANFLNMDIKPIVQKYPAIFQPSHELHDFSFGIGTLETRGSTGGGIKWWPSLKWGLALAAIVIIGYTIGKTIGIL